MLRRFLLLSSILFAFGSSAKADLTHRMTSSIQLQTNSAATQVSRIGSTYTSSGSGVTLDVGGGGSADGNVGGIGTLTDGVGQGSVATATQTSAGGSYTFSQSYQVICGKIEVLQHNQLMEIFFLFQDLQLELHNRQLLISYFVYYL